MTTFRKASENRSFKFLQEEVSKKWEKKKWKGNKSMWERERKRERERGRILQIMGNAQKIKTNQYFPNDRKKAEDL